MATTSTHASSSNSAIQHKNNSKVSVALDFGGTNFRITLFDRTSGQPLLPRPLMVQVPVSNSSDTLQQASLRVSSAFETLFAGLKSSMKQLGLGNSEIDGIFVSTRGPFGAEKKVASVDFGDPSARTWVARSLGPFEVSEGVIQETMASLTGTQGWAGLSEAEQRKEALNVAVYPLQKMLTEISKRVLGLQANPHVSVANDADANLVAALQEQYPNDLPPEANKKVAMLIVGTGVGFAVHSPKGGKISAENISTVSISRESVNLLSGDRSYFSGEGSAPLTKVAAGPFLAKRYGFQPGHKLDAMQLGRIIDHVVGYLAPIVATQMKDQRISTLYTSGGVANELGEPFALALQQELQRDIALSNVEVRPPSRMGDQIGLYGAYHIGLEAQQQLALANPAAAL